MSHSSWLVSEEGETPSMVGLSKGNFLCAVEFGNHKRDRKDM